MKPINRIALAWAIGALGATLPLRAQSCDAPLLFDLSGPGCGAGRQELVCACSECIQWDAAAGATWYEIRRCDRSGANCTIVGDTRWRNRAAVITALGVVHPAIRPTVWCAPWDDPFPDDGVSYDYTVRACTDGATGPLCAVQFSNPVAYVAAPYMCIDGGLEVPCRTNAPPRAGFHTDLDGDGITDAIDLDDDGDGRPDSIDNCLRMVNIGQRDADGDGVGDACDLHPRDPASGEADDDRDGIGDRVDVCPSVYDPLQADTDRDRTGDACDNCPSLFNELQSDTDRDAQGDRCDLDDGTIYAVWRSRSRLKWAPEAGFATWCVYRGDLAELRRSRSYTQAPGSNPLAARFCAIASAVMEDASTPAPGARAFYLVAGRPGSSSTELGLDSRGVNRANANPCP